MTEGLELSSPVYKIGEIKEWAYKNSNRNQIAERLYKKYFSNSAKFNNSSFYYVVFTNNGGVILKKASSKKVS